MNVAIGSDKQGEHLKEVIAKEVEKAGYKVIDKTKGLELDFVDSTLAVTGYLLEHPDSLGIVCDGFGSGSFMVATKVKGIVAAEVSDERTAYMTREHNNARLITLGSEIIGEGIAKSIVHEFLGSNYAGGRHQIRVDMLNKMA